MLYLAYMLGRPKLEPRQWDLLASAFSNISQGIVLFSLATIFIPEAAGLSKDFSKIVGVLFLFGGFIVLTAGVIIRKKGK